MDHRKIIQKAEAQRTVRVRWAAVSVGILAVFVFVAVLAGWYPIARVNGGFVTYHAWKQVEGAAMRFAANSAVLAADATSTQRADLPPPGEIARGTLERLIEDAIIEKKGIALRHDFKAASAQRVSRALAQHSAFADAAKLLYGLDSRAFVALVLFPQAEMDIVREDMQERQEDFDAWLVAQKRAARVRFYFVPFRWDGEHVQ